MYDVTVEESYRAVRPWLVHVQVCPVTSLYSSAAQKCVESKWNIHVRNVKITEVMFRRLQKKASPSCFWVIRWTWRETDRCRLRKLNSWRMWVQKVCFILVQPGRHCTPLLATVSNFLWSVGKQSDVLRGQRLHRHERERVPDTPGQVGQSCGLTAFCFCLDRIVNKLKSFK